MTAGVPGLGLSGLFTLFSALVLPLNRRKAPSPIGRLVMLAVAIGVALVLSSDVFTSVVTPLRDHIVPVHGQRLTGIWQAPVVLISAIIMVLVLATGEVLLHLVGTKPTPTPPPITAGARSEPGPSENPDAPEGA